MDIEFDKISDNVTSCNIKESALDFAQELIDRELPADKQRMADAANHNYENIMKGCLMTGKNLTVAGHEKLLKETEKARGGFTVNESSDWIRSEFIKDPKNRLGRIVKFGEYYRLAVFTLCKIFGKDFDEVYDIG